MLTRAGLVWLNPVEPTANPRLLIDSLPGSGSRRVAGLPVRILPGRGVVLDTVEKLKQWFARVTTSCCALVSRSELNGRLGQLRRWDDAAGRWQVVFHPRDGGGGCKVKPSNLALATADDRANGRHVDAEEIDALERLRGTFGDDISPDEDELHRCDSDGDCEGRDFSQLQQFYLILQKQHPGVAISKKAIQIINAFAEDCARRVATTAANVASTQRRAVLRVASAEPSGCSFPAR